MSKPKFVVICGYARSGKSTALERLEDSINVVSTSREVDYLVCLHHNLPRYFVDHLRNKRDDLLQEATLDYHSSCRELKIEYSESEYIPKFGRKALVESSVFNQLDTYSKPNHINVFESIGGEELEIIKDLYDIVGVINIRSNDEQKDVDIRQLDPEGLDIWDVHKDYGFYYLSHQIERLWIESE